MYKNYKFNILKSFFIWIVVFNLFTSALLAENNKECPIGATEIGCKVGIHTIANVTTRAEGHLVIENNIAYIGSGNDIVSIDISIINKPVFLKYIIKDFKKFIFDFKIKNNLIYITHLEGFSIFDIEKSKIIGTLEIEKNSYNTQTIKVINNYAYIDKDNKLYVINIANPSKPNIVNITGGTGGKFKIIKNSLFTLGRDRVYVYDISDKTKFKLLSTTETGASSSIIVNNFLYTSSASWEEEHYIKIYDISNPKKFILKKTINGYLPPVIAHNNKYLYTAFEGGPSGSTTMQIFSIIDPLNPILVSTNNQGFYNVDSALIKNNYLFTIPWNSNSLKIFDISNSKKGNVDKVIDGIYFFTRDNNNVISIENKEDFNKTLNIMNISNILNPKVIYSQDIAGLNPSTMDINKKRLVFSGRFKDITLFELSDDSNFIKKSIIKTNSTTIAKIKGNYLYLQYHEYDSDGNAIYKLDIMDISDLSKPKKINTIGIDGGYMKIVDNYIYIYNNTYLRIVDITNPKEAYMINKSLKGSFNTISIQNNLIYATNSKELVIINKSNLKNLEIVNNIPLPFSYHQYPNSSYIHDNHLFLLTNFELVIINIENHKKIKISGNIPLRNNGTMISLLEGDYIYISTGYSTSIFNWKNSIKNLQLIEDYYKTHDIQFTEDILPYQIENLIIADADSNEYALDKIPAHKALTIVADTNINTIADINFKWSIDGKVVKEGLGTDNSYLDYTFIKSSTKISLSIQRGSQAIVTKEITATLDGEYIAYSIDNIVISDADSNEFASDSVPTNKPLTIIAETNINTTDDITFTWSIDGVVIKEGLGKDGGDYLDYTFTKPTTTILLAIERGSEGVVSKELKVSTLLDTLKDLRAIGENRKIVVENGYFEEGIDRTGDYYAPTGNRLGIYDSKSNELIVNIKLTNPSAVKIYNNQIIGIDGSAYITFTDDKLPLFEGKFIIEDEVLRNLLLAEALNEEKLNRVIDADKYCEGITKYETLKNNTKKQDCKELIDTTKLDRELVKFLSDNIVPVTDATLLVGIDADAIGLSPTLLATPYLWDGKLDLAKKKFKLTALASSASVFNLKGGDYSLLSDVASTAVKTSLLSTAKSLGRIPFVYTLKSNGSATTEIGKSKLNIKALTLEFSDSKSLVLESKVIKTSDNDKYRKNTATIKNAKAYLSMSLDEKATNIGFQINNAKLEKRDGTYELLSYDGGANFSIPNIPLGKGRSLKNISGGIYFVGRSSVYDTDDWPVAFIDKRKGVKSKFYIYLKGHGEYVKESAPNKVDPNDPLGSMNSAWTNGDDYKNTLSVDFKVIPLAVANYDNGLLLSADIGYSTDGTTNIINLKDFKLKELEGKYRYDTNLDDFLWKVTAGVEALKYRGKGSLYWNWGENLALGGTVKDFGLSITNNKRFILGEGCILGGTLTPTFMNLAECPKLTSSCSSNIGLSKNTLISNGFMFGMKATPHYESRFSAGYPWENPFPYLEANAELGFKIVMDEKVKKGNSNRFQFSDPKITANLAGSGSLSMKIPKSKSSYFPFPTKDITLLELCVGMSPFDVKRYYDEGLFVTTEKVDNIQGLFGFYGMAKLSNKNAVVFYSFMPFKIKDVEEEQTWLYGTNFKIEVKDTVSKHKLGKYRKISKTSSSTFKMNKTIDGENAIETLVIPENNSGPLILVKNVNDVEITTPSGEVVNASNVENYNRVAIEKETNSVTIGLNNPDAGTWKFKFKNNADYEFLVFSENIAPTVNASLATTSIEYGTALTLDLDYKDTDSTRGFIKVIATSSEGEEFILFDDNITAPYNDSIDLYISNLGEYDLTLFSTDGLRAYSKVSLGSVTITEPSKFMDNLKVTTGKDSLVSEWKSLNLVDGFDVTIFNKTTSIKNVYDKVSSNFSKSNLVNGEYTLTVDARYNGNIVETLSKDFVINSEKSCESMSALVISEDFTDGYFLDFTTTNASYYLVDIQSFTDKFKHIERKQVTGKIDLSSFVGEGVYMTIEAIDECGNTLSKSKEMMISNQIDTDNDLLYDDWEIKYFGDLNQLADDDFDSDEVSNLDEMKQYTSPINGDTDDDKVSDKEDSHPYLNIDNNQNRVSDDWEFFYNIVDLSLDPDGDGVNSYDEYFLGTNPKVKDNNLEENNQEENKAPVIQTDKDNFKTLTTSLSKNLIINASTSFDSDSDSLTYSWSVNNKIISTNNIFDYEFKELGKHYLKLTLSDGNEHFVSKEWLIFITKESYDFKYTDIDKSDISIYHSGVKFTIPKSVGRGKIFTMEIPLKDLPIKPTGYTFIEENGKVLIFNGKNTLSNEMSIDHVSNDQLLRYSYTENKWYIVAKEGKSVNSKNIGLFALASKDKITVTNSDSGESSGGGCFIATAAYGSYLQKDVQLLRIFRDKYLLTNEFGKSFVDSYYNYSPSIANYIAQHDYLRTVVRWVLTGVISIIKYPWVALLLFLFIFRRKILLLRI
jgi:hypothetical protein